MAYIGQKLVQQLRTTGFRSTIAQRVDDGFTRFTSGLSWNDVRGVLRGDPPTKPNPRVKPHTEGFWFHIRPTFYHEAVTTLYPTFRLGYLSALLFTFEIITGIFLMIFYTPAPAVAYGDMLDIITNVPFGNFMRDLHRLGAEIMVIVVALHMARTFITGSYKKPRQFTWFTGVILLIVTLFLSFSGYLLPWDQLAFWAVTIGTSMADAVPVFGPAINLLLRGAPDIGAGGLLRFYLFHVVLFPLIGVIFVAVHYYKVVRWGISLPPEMESIGEDTARKVPPEKRVNFMPDILTNEIMYAAVFTGLIALATIALYPGAPLESHSNSLKTPLHTVAPWYFYWLQGLLKIPHMIPFLPAGISSAVDQFFANVLGITPKIFWGVVVGPLAFLLLMVVPYIDPNPSRRYKDRKIMLALGALFAFVLLYLSLAGIPTGVPITGFGYVGGDPATEVGQEFIPDEGVGPVKRTPYEALLPSEQPYEVYDAPNTESPELNNLIKEIHASMESRKVRPDPNGRLLDPRARASVTIEQTQDNLRHFILNVDYTGEAPNQDLPPPPLPFSKDTYIHKDSGYANE
jgi:quinol-cytochrome oxidoreductase complex cytochrome b subunit